MNPLDLLQSPETDPTLVFGLRDCLYAADFLTAALVELDLFTWLAPKPRTQEEIQSHLAAHTRPVDVLLSLLQSYQLLEKVGNEFALTPTAREFLVRTAPWFIGPYYASLRERPVVKDLLKVLATGKPANWGSQQNALDWHKAMETEAFAHSFTAAMDCRGVFLAQALATKLPLQDRHALLDIAGGSGIYACTLTTKNPGLRASVLEKPPVDTIARNSIAKRGCEPRVSVVAGDMLTEPLPQGYDVHLWSNVLHDWDVPEVLQLIQSSANSLAKGGLFVMHDAFLNRDKSGPKHVAEYSVLLMHSTQGRCYGVAEMEEWLASVGFAEFAYHETAAARGFLTAIRQ